MTKFSVQIYWGFHILLTPLDILMLLSTTSVSMKLRAGSAYGLYFQEINSWECKLLFCAVTNVFAVVLMKYSILGYASRSEMRVRGHNRNKERTHWLTAAIFYMGAKYSLPIKDAIKTESSLQPVAAWHLLFQFSEKRKNHFADLFLAIFHCYCPLCLICPVCAMLYVLVHSYNNAIER